jgi:hypothetical protein
VDGVSLVPLMNGDSLQPRSLFWHYPHYGNQGGQPSSIIRQGKWKLIYFWEDNHAALYDLSEDIAEQNDISNSVPEMRDKLLGQLQAFLTKNNARVPEIDPMYDSSKANDRRLYLQTDVKSKLEIQRTEMLNPDFTPNTTWWGSQTATK